jgi:hypothetical protein
MQQFWSNIARGGYFLLPSLSRYVVVSVLHHHFRTCPLSHVSPMHLHYFPLPCYTQEADLYQAGALIRDDLTPAHIILGIKEVPISELITSPVRSTTSSSSLPRTHLMFSHTTKAQPYNMPLLSRFLRASNGGGRADLLPRLIDYELLTKINGNRTVGFGWFAGGRHSH